MSTTDRRLQRWMQWLSLSATPAVHRLDEPARLLRVDGGLISDLGDWPLTRGARLYLAVDRDGPVYLGQTSDILSVRVHRHFGCQATLDERVKASTWVGVASATFPQVEHGELNVLERRAAHWIVPAHHRRGRRHPRTRL